MLAGAFLLLLGLLRLGGVIKFIPYPLTVGFTCGIAVVIATTQIRDALGLKMPPPPAECHEKIIAYARHIDSFDYHAFLLTLAALAIISWWPRVTRRMPGSLVAILVLTPLVHVTHWPVETIGTRFGSVPAHIPAPSLPEIDWRQIPKFFQPALAIALLGGIESILSAVVADGMTGRRHRSNTELVAQGIANIASPLFQGIPATGANARTATNIKNGARTPVAGMIHALTLLAIVMAFGKWAKLIPMPILATILLKVSLDMGEWHLLARFSLRAPRSDAFVMILTFLLTIFVDLAVAIEAGVVLASFAFLERMSRATHLGFVTEQLDDDSAEISSQGAEPVVVKRPGIEVFQINGPFFFGAADRFKDEIRRLEKPPRVLILHMHHVPIIDATGLQAIEDVLHKCRREGTALILSGVQSQPWEKLFQSGLYHQIGPENVHYLFRRALERAEELLSASPSQPPKG